MENGKEFVKAAVAAEKFTKERDYWLNRLSGNLGKSFFPYDFKRKIPFERQMETMKFQFTGELFQKLIKAGKNSDARLHIILAAGLAALLHKYSGSNDIMIGTPIYRQEQEGEFINTVLILRNRVETGMSFKELVLAMKETITAAVENQNYAVEILLPKLGLSYSDEEFPLFNLGLVMENIQPKKYLSHIPLDLIFCFQVNHDGIQGEVEFNSSLYHANSIAQIASGYNQLLTNALANADLALSRVDILTEAERERLLVDFNDTAVINRFIQPVSKLFEEQVTKTPGNEAIAAGTAVPVTYEELNREANRVAHLLKKNGVTNESVVGIMMEPQAEMTAALLGILKVGGAYLPVDPHMPIERICGILEDSGAAVLLTNAGVIKDIPFTALQGFEYHRNMQDVRLKVTPPRPHIAEFDRLPHPNRRFMNLKNYKNKIGMASVTNCISLQATRGCPYQCLYCHKIWSKHHIYRSIENICSEIEYYYRHGVTNFAFIDDCFNLDIKKSQQVFKTILEKRLKVQLFFPNGLRGDIMTPDYIDLMVEAGTRGINLSLETASPRLQKLLKKNLDLEKFKQVIDYIASRHPHVILELASMHGFPGETEEEAMMTLNFIKSIQWLHFPYLHILKIFPNTEMEAFALEQGISKRDIMISKNRAFHELPETLPFPKSFTRKYQADFLNNYFLNKERLMQVLPYQMKVLNEEALVQKYNAYLPVEIKRIDDLLEFAQLEDLPIPGEYRERTPVPGTIFDWEAEKQEIYPNAKKILLLDLSQHFSSHHMLYRVIEQPLGLIYLLTYLKERFGDKIDGRIYKSGIDFDSFAELKTLVDEYQPDLVGIRTLTFFKEFFHETVSLLRQWGVLCPIITGGPYASSDYNTILEDKNVDLVVFGEGEYTMEELISGMFDNNFKLPGPAILDSIQGIAYALNKSNAVSNSQSRDVILLDRLRDVLLKEKIENPGLPLNENNLVYVMYTSGSTGKPKGVMVEYRQVNNCLSWLQDKFNLGPGHVVVNRTNLTFDPSVWELFWPLSTGARVKILDAFQRKDAEFLIQLMAEDPTLTIMYCPATLVNLMTYLLDKKTVKSRLKLPWLIIGAEPIRVDIVKNFYQNFAGKIINTYGPTECTINNTYYDLDPLDGRPIVPIGKPVANNKIYILSPDIQPMPVNIAGEIYIGGGSVARGYINNIEKTALNFMANPFGEGKLYKTGDIGRWLPDGVIEIMGRQDEQVKIRGYRVELGEIRSALLKHKAVSECIITIITPGEDKYPGIQNDETRVCKSCGITTKYPGIAINDDGICRVCQEISQYRPVLQSYFKNLEALEQTIREANRVKTGVYDCLLLYSGGKGAANALYRLHDMGFKILALTYDNGYMGKANLANIKMITAKLNVDHVVLTHKNTDAILRESLKNAHTVCRGCFLTSSALAAEYAYQNNINVVVGATLSRGQIIDNKLFLFLQQGITNPTELEAEVSRFQQASPKIEKSYFDLIGGDLVKNGSVYEKVTFLDFYRYCDMSNEEMIAYLNEKDPYWQTRKSHAIYSTNCPIKQIGDYAHLQERGFHFYGTPTYWEKRLGNLTLKNIEEDLECRVTARGFANFLKGLHYEDGKKNHGDDQYLCAYFVPNESVPGDDFSSLELRKYLLQQLPDHMIPNYFIPLAQIPLTPNGKVDRKALPSWQLFQLESGIPYIAPTTQLEKTVSVIWKELLNVDRVGVQDNFFDLGGNSLNIVIMGHKLKEQLNIDIPVVTLFTYPTIHSLARYLEQGDNHAEKIEHHTQQLDKSQEKIKKTTAKIKNMRRQNAQV